MEETIQILRSRLTKDGEELEEMHQALKDQNDIIVEKEKETRKLIAQIAILSAEVLGVKEEREKLQEEYDTVCDQEHQERRELERLKKQMIRQPQ